MKKSRFFTVGVLVLILALGLVLVGCSTGDDGGGGNNSGKKRGGNNNGDNNNN